MIQLFIICFGCCFSSKKKENVTPLTPQPVFTQTKSFSTGCVPTNNNVVVLDVQKERVIQEMPVNLNELNEKFSEITVITVKSPPEDIANDVKLTVPIGDSYIEGVVSPDVPTVIVIKDPSDVSEDLDLFHVNDGEFIEPISSEDSIKNSYENTYDYEAIEITKDDSDSESNELVDWMNFEPDLTHMSIAMESPLPLNHQGSRLPTVSGNKQNNLISPFTHSMGDIDGPIGQKLRTISPIFDKEKDIDLNSKTKHLSTKLRENKIISSSPRRPLKKSYSFHQAVPNKLQVAKKGFKNGVPPKLPAYRSVQELFRNSGLNEGQLLEGVSTCDHACGKIVSINLTNGTCLREISDGKLEQHSIETLGCCVYH